MAQRTLKPLWIVAILTVAAVAIHGYHYGIEDEAIYLPGIKKMLDPALYPHDSQFFLGQTRGTLLPFLVAQSSRLLRTPLPWVVLGWHLASLILFLAAYWRIATRCFGTIQERVGGVALVTALLTMPIAGTSIYLADQHLHPRTLASALVLLAVTEAVENRRLRAGVLVAAAFVIHPLMAAIEAPFVILQFIPARVRIKEHAYAMLIAVPFIARPTPAWRQALATREYYSLRNWEWYEWLGLIAPFAVVWALRRLAHKEGDARIERLLSVLLAYGSLMLAVTFVCSLPQQTAFLSPLQPFRFLHIVYGIMLLVAGGYLARFILRRRILLWLVIFAPLSFGMFFAQRELFSSSSHIDVPGLSSPNPWVQAFAWVRQNTPPDAYFALNPRYMSLRGNNAYGFRAIADRSQLADISKDAGAVTISPALAAEWKPQVDALDNWKSFSREDYGRLNQQFGVAWFLIEAGKHTDGLDCPYANNAVSVCRWTATNLPAH